jgi:outer membrane protein assembly factor BamD
MRGRVPRTLLRVARRVAGCLFLGLVAGGSQCPGANEASDEDLSYSESAEENYQLGMEALVDGNTVEAQKYFEQVMRRFPYDRVATLARLRIADCDFEAENYRAAATGYQGFLQRFPADHEADYAMFRRGLSFFRLIPTTWFIMPASYVRDLAPANDALRELCAFVSRFPDSEYVAEAKARIRDCLTELARGELSVAEFYLRHDRQYAAAMRARAVLREYGESGLAPDALLLLGRIALDAGERSRAEAYFLLLISRFPESHQTERALRYLGFLEGRGEEP